MRARQGKRVPPKEHTQKYVTEAARSLKPYCDAEARFVKEFCFEGY